MATAKFVKVTKDDDRKGHQIKQILFEVNPPMQDFEGTPHRYVIASAAYQEHPAPFAELSKDPLVHEVYLFPSDSEGEITSWMELPGSKQGTLDHIATLNGAGYEVEWTS